MSSYTAITPRVRRAHLDEIARSARKKPGPSNAHSPGCNDSDRSAKREFRRNNPHPNWNYDTFTSIFFGCASGSFVIVTCSTPLVSSAVIVFGSTVSGSDTLRETLP